MTVSGSPVYADDAKATKKSIYDEQEERQLVPASQGLEDQPTRLIALMREAREETVRLFNVAKTHGQIVVDRWVETEKCVESLVQRTVPQGEKLAPGIIYVGISMLAGPIFTRRRNFAVRWTSPLIFGTLSAFYFLPGTANVVLRNIWGRYGDPQTIDNVREEWQRVKQTQRDVSRKVAENVQELRMSLQEGRSFGAPKTEALEPVKAAVEDVQAKAADVSDAIAEKAASASSAVQEKEDKAAADIPAAVEEAAAPAEEPSPSPKAESKPKKLPLGFKESSNN
ncbi:hypothetical protein GQ54DRAFT_297987 [Martensiomyces pterosporus]|nr:hypothetical protein GQ54DRAFT_297987 [Martensiomyces pterosporus]